MITGTLKQSSDRVTPANASAAKPVSPGQPKLSTKLAGGLPKGIKLACKKSQQMAGNYYLSSHKNFVGLTNCRIALLIMAVASISLQSTPISIWSKFSQLTRHIDGLPEYERVHNPQNRKD